MMSRKDLYLENVDTVLKLMNDAKNMGYEFGFEQMAKVVGLDMVNIDSYDEVDLTTTLSINETYTKNKGVFESAIKQYLNKNIVIY